MKRSDLEHIIRASSAITNEYEFVVIGSQAILGSDPNPPPELTVSAEADIYPLRRPELNEKIDGAIGEFSEFHTTFGFYAQGVDPTTATLPHGWEQRLVRVPDSARDTGVGYCLSVVDLFLSKAVAGRPKDRAFCIALLRHNYLTLEQTVDMAKRMPAQVNQRQLVATIRRWAGEV